MAGVMIAMACKTGTMERDGSRVMSVWEVRRKDSISISAKLHDIAKTLLVCVSTLTEA
jgi:G:T-mismatch repair DNA endonuclease (very short patch repair protein)